MHGSFLTIECLYNCVFKLSMVKILPHWNRNDQKKTKVKKKTSNPQFNETFYFEVTFCVVFCLFIYFMQPFNIFKRAALQYLTQKALFKQAEELLLASQIEVNDILKWGCQTVAFPFNCCVKNDFHRSTYVKVFCYLESLYMVSLAIRSSERTYPVEFALKIFKNIKLTKPPTYLFNKTM